MEPLFEELNGGPVARLPHKADGTPRSADGVNTYTLAQAAKRFNWPEQALRQLHASTFADVAGLVGRTAAEPAPAGEPEIQDCATRNPALAQQVTDDLLRLSFGHLDDGEFERFRQVCAARGANPWLRTIIPEVRQSQDDAGQLRRELHFITTIEYLRSIAGRSGEYAGQVGPEWCGDDGAWRDVWLESGFPRAARVGIMRMGFNGPLWGVVKWEEAAIGPDGSIPEHYERMPAYMLGVRAEAAAIRRAFSDAARLYLADEVATIPSGPRPPRKAPAEPGERVTIEDCYDQLPPDEARQRSARAARRRTGGYAA